MPDAERYHEITAERKPEFVARGYKGRYFFPHHVSYLPRPLPEQAKTAQRLWDVHDPDALRCMLVFGGPELIAKFPDDLFLDPEVMIHREHMGRPGLVATAHLYIDGDRLYTDEHQSDLVQRIIYRREHKSQIEKRFGSWHHMLLNAVLNFAVMNNLREIHIPTAARVVQDYLGGSVNPDMFERLYDRNVLLHFDAQQRGGRWVIDVDRHRDKLIPLALNDRPTPPAVNAACIIHDVPARNAFERSQLIEQIEQLLEVEAEQGVRATYCIPAPLMADLKDRIEAAGHDVAFFGHDHARYRYPNRSAKDETPMMKAATLALRRLHYAAGKRLPISKTTPRTATAITRAWGNSLGGLIGRPPMLESLAICRQAGYYVKGYRASLFDAEAGLTDAQLRYHHFEWVIRDAKAGPSQATCEQGLMHLSLAADAKQALETTADGYSDTASTPKVLNLPIASIDDWLGNYPYLLRSITGQGLVFRTPQGITNAHQFARAL